MIAISHHVRTLYAASILYTRLAASSANSVDQPRMNRSHKISRLSSDFSIARILAEDGETKSRRESFVAAPQNHSTTEEYLLVPPFNANPRLEFPNEEATSFPPSSGISSSSSSRSTNLSQIFSPTCTTESLKFGRNELSWLHCTRYRPPKLPRKSSSGKTGRRRPGAHPRIPFTALQIQTLENQYRSTAYLSRRDVLHLSTTLRLPQSRVKIWFQNRRARDRRETGMVGSNVTIISEDVSLSRTSPDSPADESPSTNPP